MNITDLRRSSAKIILGTSSDTLALGGVTVSSNGIPSSGSIFVATGSNSGIWLDALSFGSNANDVGSVSTMGSSPSNTRADHVHRGVSALTAAGSNALYGSVNLQAGTGVGITSAGDTITIASSGAIAAGTYVEARNGGSEVVASASVSGTYTIDLANGNWQAISMTGDTTFAFTGATNGEGDSFLVELTPNGYSATWPGSVTWPGGTAPTQSTSDITLWMFLTRDGGTTWRGFLAGGGASVSSPSSASNSFSEVALTADASIAITSPSSTSLLFSAPFVSEVVTDSEEIVWHGSDIVHSLVRLY